MAKISGAILAVVAPLALSACATATMKQAEAPLSSNPEEPYLFEPQNGDPVEAFRGSFTVPENRADPNSRAITLHYVRFPSTNPEPGAPIVYLAGGPGGSGVGTARGRRFDLFMKLRSVADVIAYDQRGTGWSSDLAECKTDISYPLDKPAIIEEALPYYEKAAAFCLDFWAGEGFDIKGYNTMENARDLDALRAHLGAEKINLWSISYGTHLAMAAVKVMDERIERIVMTGAEGLDQTVKLPARTDEFFGRVQEAIDQDPKAKAVYPDVVGMMRRVQAKLDAEPATARIEGEGGAADIVFGKQDLQLLTSFAISDPENTAQILAIYLALDNGAYDQAGGFVYRFLRHGTIELNPMPTAIDVASGISEEREALVYEQAKTSLVGSFLNFPMPHLKDAFGDLDLGDDFRSIPRSSTPVFLLTGTLDGRTYPEGQAEAVAGFSSVTRVFVENAGHNLFMSDPDVGERIKAFLQGETVSDAPIVLQLPDFTKPLQIG